MLHRPPRPGPRPVRCMGDPRYVRPGGHRCLRPLVGSGPGLPALTPARADGFSNESPFGEPTLATPALTLCSADMASPRFDVIEREQLADLLDELGADAPTLLEPWTTRDLVSHLVLREHDSLAAPGLVVPGAWARFAERRRRALARQEFSWLVATFRSGPPRGFFRIGWVRSFPTLNELFVHHEDVRRANGGGPRTNSPTKDAALWRNVRRARWFLTRRLRSAGLELQWAGTNRIVRARRGRSTARIVGCPGELLLFLFGRQSAADVEIRGPAAAVEAVRHARLGM
jgi:uncharacterized protein (TIGR03085 family)